MKTILTILIVLIAPCFIAAQTPWKVKKSSVTFTIKNAGLIVKGTLGGLIADIKFEPTNYLKSSIEASVDVNTINTGIDLRNSDLKKEKYFNASKYPKIVLKSTSFTKEKGGTFKGLFKLTIKGVAKDVTIPFSCNKSAKMAVFNGSFMINRRDYAVGGKSLTMSDDVNISIVVNAVK
jgi:polyisoprenoid-binding protein YceI